jgi:hypothetical protein
MNVTALMQNKLQEEPEHHQDCKSNLHLITCPTNSRISQRATVANFSIERDLFFLPDVMTLLANGPLRALRLAYIRHRER